MLTDTEFKVSCVPILLKGGYSKMKNVLLLIVIILLTSCSTTSAGQDEDKTLSDSTITFENVLGTAPVEGQDISNQFQSTFGITFHLTNGGLPKIAEVGAPTAAFESDFGEDTPAPNQDTGLFFLTDDGNLSGLTSPALLVTFDVPTSVASGQILDIDFDETFTIEARNSSDTVLETLTIQAGDEGTGDGIATLWSFDRTSADIASIKFQGTRTTSGSFGLGFDNFNPTSATIYK